MESLSLVESLKLPSVNADLDTLSECPAMTPSEEDVINVPFEDFKRTWEIFRCLLVSVSEPWIVIADGRFSSGQRYYAKSISSVRFIHTSI